MRFVLLFLALLVIGANANSQKPHKGGSDWRSSEYSGQRTNKDIRTALASKGFAWLSGSPADNDKLSVGKNAQFFGFVALRYDSGRAARRGDLGRAFYAIATPTQRRLMADVVRAEKQELAEWWAVREKILRLLETHLYTGAAIEPKEMGPLGLEFGRLNAAVALHEAKAFAALEDSLTHAQWASLRQWRTDPEAARSANQHIRMAGWDKTDLAQLEDIYAKGFSWLTGSVKDNLIIPLGQPAQFFGFVSIRHKSGHAASRARIAKAFLEILSPDQRSVLDGIIPAHQALCTEFLAQRRLMLEQMQRLRTKPDSFDAAEYERLAAELGQLEIEVGILEASMYRALRLGMSAKQSEALMTLRSQYILDPSTTEQLSLEERGKHLAILCIGCHGDGTRPGPLAPSLANVFGRPIASQAGFDYSDALRRHSGRTWTAISLNDYLANPKAFAPGTKMEFQGLLDPTDREAVINYLKDSVQ
jgi:cytochrome c2